MANVQGSSRDSLQGSPYKTWQEAKEQYWSEDELRNAKIHSNKFLDVVVSDAKEAPYHQQYALIMLNSTKQQHYLHNLWKAATVRVVPEHGLRVVQEQLTEGTRLEFPPEAIVGKLTEVDGRVLQAYRDRGVRIVSEVDDDLSEVEKCLAYLKTRGEKQKGELNQIIIYDSITELWEKQLGVFHAMLKHANDFRRIVYMNDSNLADVMTPGKHIFEINQKVQQLNDRCGLFPIQAPVQSVRTQGLHWNLDGQRLMMGQRVSEANCITSKRILIEASDNLLFTCKLDATKSACKDAKLPAT